MPTAGTPSAEATGYEAVDDLRCSTWARTNRVDPVATAGTYRGYLLVEWALPWPRDAAELAELADAARLAFEARFRLQLLAPAILRPPLEADGHLRVAVYRWSGSGFVGSETKAPAGETASAARALLADVEAGRPATRLEPQATEVLVCGHGSRDRCCGSLGTRLAADAAGGGVLAGEAALPGAGVRWWRTSHTGGHRFAPTALLLPAGTLWANLDSELLSGIIGRTLEPEEAARHYRGCAGLGPRPVQAIERELLAREGWGMLDELRRGEDVGAGRFRLTIGGGGSARVFEAEVTVARELPVPVCGAPVSEARKTEGELAVRGLTRVA